MGDMKTPDFDDLLAAFDIPDATGLDAKEPIHVSQEEALKHAGICLDDSLLINQAVTAADVPSVSVIVKNTSRQESLEDFGPTLQNGFRGQEPTTETVETTNSGFSKSFVTDLNGESSGELLGKARLDGTPMLSQSLSHFSPISSPESEDAQCSKDPKETPTLSEASVLVEPSISDNQTNLDLCVFDDCPMDSNGPKNSKAERNRSEEPHDICLSNKTDKTPRIHRGLPPPSVNHNFIETNCDSETSKHVPTHHSHAKSQTSKSSSCFDALAALSARKDPRESSTVHIDCVKASPNVPISPRSPRSPLEAVKRLIKPSDSPVSICSDNSGKLSPAVASGSPPAIPRVRIKTIKTTSGQIKRTVTSVLPDSETDEFHSAYESSPSQSMISEDSYSNTSPHHSQSAAVDGFVGMQTKANPATSSKALLRKSGPNLRRSGVTQSAAGLHESGGSVKRSAAHHGQRPKRASATAGHTTSTNLLPKAMHLASLNLVPHSVAASVAARSSSHQKSQHTLSPTVCSTVPLVHQVKTAKPPPGTSTPNAAAGTLNRLLNNANPVPTYVPNLNPPPESNIVLPQRGYCCLECGDSFVVERSLVYHYNRRSVHIEVRCMHCAKTIVFFNKCALLAHAREHKNSGMVMQCTQLHMKPIAEEQMFAPLSTEPMKADSYPSPSPSSRHQPVLPLYPDNVIRHRLCCLECDKQLPDYKAFAGHYQRLSEDVKGLMCHVCSMLLPNKCSFRAHERLHAHKSPYCCPECGALSRSADIQKHVKENCLHYARKAWYKCLHCDVVFKTLQGQKAHIEERHCEVFYKCTICPVAFKTTASFEVHLKNKHNACKVSPQSVFKCSCETVFKKKQLLFEHFHQNANKRLTSVFKCPECNSVFPQKYLLMQHFKGVHVGNTAAETENSSIQTDSADMGWHQDAHSVQHQKSHRPVKHVYSARKKAAQDSGPRAKPTGWTCGECLQWFPERDAFVSHVKAAHRKPVKKYPCRHCEQSFKSTTSLRRHIRNDHDGKKKIYTCWYCTDTKTIFTTSVMLKNHISLMHGIKNPDLGQMPKTPVQQSKKALEKGLASKTPAVDSQEEAGHRTFSLEAPSAKRLKTQFRCSKCGFTTHDGAQFQLHIPQHKTDENTPQCLHCGLCFTSLLSLSRHLFIVHKVKEEEEETEVKGMEQDVRPPHTDDVNDPLPEPASACRGRTANCNPKLSSHSQSQAVPLR